jgi:hypothetical protein
MFESLERLGNVGPVLELPFTDGMAAGERESESLLLSAYHARRTSACFSSFMASSLPESVRSAVSPPLDDDSVGAVRSANFSTIWIRRDPEGKWGQELAAAWLEHARGDASVSVLVDTASDVVIGLNR